MLEGQVENVYLVVVVYRLYYEKSVLILLSNLFNIEIVNLVKSILTELNGHKGSGIVDTGVDIASETADFISNSEKLIIKLIKLYQINILLNICYTIWYDYNIVAAYDNSINSILHHENVNTGFSLVTNLVILNPWMKYFLIVVNYFLMLVLFNLNLAKFDDKKISDHSNLETEILSNLKFLILETHGILTIFIVNLYDARSSISSTNDVEDNHVSMSNEQSNLVSLPNNDRYDSTIIT